MEIWKQKYFGEGIDSVPTLHFIPVQGTQFESETLPQNNFPLLLFSWDRVSPGLSRSLPKSSTAAPALSDPLSSKPQYLRGHWLVISLCV